MEDGQARILCALAGEELLYRRLGLAWQHSEWVRALSRTPGNKLEGQKASVLEWCQWVGAEGLAATTDLLLGLGASDKERSSSEHALPSIDKKTNYK